MLRWLRRPAQSPPFLAVPGPCDLACAWCNYERTSAVSFGSASGPIARELQTLFAQGHRAVGFGICHTEPTSSPELVEIVEIARRTGFSRIVLSTSGVRLARAHYVRDLARAGVSDVILSLPGPDSPVSDALLAQQGAARAKLDAVANCLSAGLRTDVVLMFLRPALHALPETARIVARLPRWRSRRLLLLSGCLMDPVPAMPERRYAMLWPRYGEVAWALRRIRDQLPTFALHSSALPPCVRSRIPGVHPVEPRQSASSPRFTHPVALCEGCRSAPRCRGVYEPYWRTHGAPLLPESGEAHPASTDLQSLREAIELRSLDGVSTTSEDPGWQTQARARLAPFISGSASIEGYRLRHGHQEGAALITAWEADADRMQIAIEPSLVAARCFVRGARFALSYRSDTPLDSPARERLMRGVLAALEG